MGGDAVRQVGARPAQNFCRQLSATRRGRLARVFQDQLLQVASANAKCASKYRPFGDCLQALSE